MVSHVFKEAEPGLDFSDDALDVGPQVAGIVCPLLMSGNAEGLAGIAASDAIHNATPRLAVEGFDIAPDWRIVKMTVANTGERDSDGERFPLHITDCASGWLGESQPEFDASDAGT
jgi:hypothetical protein